MRAKADKYPFKFIGCTEVHELLGLRAHNEAQLISALALIIALFAVSYQSLRAAFTDPVDCLRYE